MLLTYGNIKKSKFLKYIYLSDYNDDEYRKARKIQGDVFTYHQPIIIAEGACFLETLIKKAFNQ